MQLEVYNKIIINYNNISNVLILFPVIDLCRVFKSYYKIVIIKIFKIYQFFHHLLKIVNVTIKMDAKK